MHIFPIHKHDYVMLQVDSNLNTASKDLAWLHTVTGNSNEIDTYDWGR